MSKWKWLYIDIHNQDGCYASTEKWACDAEEYKNVSYPHPNRKYINEQLDHFIDAGYIIGNVYWADKEAAA